jgi:two-component system response regulator (stage 0 sporulation protein F)
MFEGLKVLVVDDEPDLREILKDEFTFEGAEVFEAKNGKEAFEIVKQHNLSAILSDIRMPGGDGIQLVKDLRSTDMDHVPILLITGFADIKNFEAYDLGADGFFTKPFHLEALRDGVQQLMQSPEVRWAKEFNTGGKTITVAEDAESLMPSGRLKLGRGGLLLKQDPSSLKSGEGLRIQFKNGEVSGVIRWLRTEASDLDIGLGLEIFSVSSSLLPHFVQTLKQSKPKSFIPQN